MGEPASASPTRGPCRTWPKAYRTPVASPSCRPLAGLGAPLLGRPRHRHDLRPDPTPPRPAHLARATFEAIAYQIADVFEAMQADIGQPLDGLRADGGATANPFLMQLQADLIGRPVERADIAEVGALGAAAMALAALGTTPHFAAGTTRFVPAMAPAEVEAIRTRWNAAIEHVLG